MPERSETRIIRPLSKGKVTIPVEFRRALGIDEKTPLRVTLTDRAIEIAPVSQGAAIDQLREYSDQEIDRFLEEDRLTPQLADQVRRLLAEAAR